MTKHHAAGRRGAPVGNRRAARFSEPTVNLSIRLPESVRDDHAARADAAGIPLRTWLVRQLTHATTIQTD